MGQLYCLADVKSPAKRHHHALFFNRSELNQLLSLYSRRVISGEWRDYALDQRDGMAVFSIFRHSQERPLYCIAKRRLAASRGVEYLVFRGRETLRRTKTLAEALAVFDRRLQLV